MDQHPESKPDCPGNVERSPYLRFETNEVAWRCVYCRVFGKVNGDGTLMYVGTMKEITAEGLVKTVERAVRKHYGLETEQRAD